MTKFRRHESEEQRVLKLQTLADAIGTVLARSIAAVAGAATGILYSDGSALSSLTIGSGLSLSGGTLSTSGAGSGTVTSVSGAGTVSGLTLSGTVTASGSLTLGGTLLLTSGNVTTALGFTPENAANRNAVNGYAGLDSSGLIPAALLPSYVDDVLEYADLASFPGTGTVGKIYIALDTGKIYRWSGSAYVEISASPGSTDSVVEGSVNVYFTNARARAAVSASGSITYNPTTGVFSYTAPTLATVATSGSAADLTGNLAVARFDGGSGASSATFWRGDGTWAALPSGALVGTSDAQTLTNKRIDWRVSSAASGDVTADISTTDMVVRTALSAGITINAPTGSPVDGSRLVFRFKDNGTARALTWNSIFRATTGTTLPATTTVGKTVYVGCFYNATETKWDVMVAEA